ncbi:MAG: hypothetical protein Q8M40_12275 [Legionella sp.]|nr:hypothetical protein [Legionella sp.]
MKLNRDVLIASIIKYQIVFFRLLDHIDENDGALEVPEKLYLHSYNNIICADENDDAQYHLSVNTLLENGVFIHHDKNAGIITIERVIVDLLRFLDIKRAKELTHFDFEQMRSQLSSSVNQILAQTQETQEFNDGMSTFHNLMSEIHSKIKENVNALTVQVDSLATEYKSYSAGSTDVSVFNLYDKVTSLFHRFVMPCYEFIDPSMEMVKTQSFSKSVDLLINFFGSTDIKDIGTSNRIQLRKTAISSYYKDIAALARKLEQFSSHLEKDRDNYLAIDNAYNQLMESIIPLRHGRKRNMYLSPTSKVFANHNTLDGLTTHRAKFDAKLKWDSGRTSLRFKAYLVSIESLPTSSKYEKLAPISPNLKPDQDRQILITKMLLSKPYLNDISDIHKFISEYLHSDLSNFQLIDVLYGVETFLTLFNKHIKRAALITKHRMDDGRYFIDYIQLEYKREAKNV